MANYLTNGILEYLDSNKKPPFPVDQWESAKSILRFVAGKLEICSCGFYEYLECEIKEADLLDLVSDKSKLRDAVQTLARTRLIEAYESSHGIFRFYLDAETHAVGVMGYSPEERPYLVRQLYRDPNIDIHGYISLALETVKLKGLSYAAKSVHMLLSTEPDIGYSGLAEWLTKQSANCTLTQANEIIDELVAFEALKRVHDDWLVFDIVFDIEDEVNHD